MKITVLGSGAWGTALAMVLVGNNHDVTLWSHREKMTEALRTGKGRGPAGGASVHQRLGEPAGE